MSKQSARNRKRNSQMIWWVVGLAVVVVGGLVVINQTGKSTSQPVAPVAVKTDAEVHADKNVMGNANAKVQLVEWGDYL